MRLKSDASNFFLMAAANRT